MPLCKVAEAVSGITTPQHVTPSTQRNVRPDTHTETHDPSYHLNMMVTLHHPLICVVFVPSFVSLPKKKISMKRNKNKRQYVGNCKRPPSAPHLI